MKNIFIVVATDTGEAMNLFASDNEETAEACKNDLELFLQMKKMFVENKSTDTSAISSTAKILVSKWGLKPHELNFLDWLETHLIVEEIPFLETEQK